MQSVYCRQCEQTYFGALYEGEAPWDCDLCGGVRTVTPVDESAVAVGGRRAGRSRSGAWPAVAAVGIGVVGLAILVGVFAGRGGDEAEKPAVPTTRSAASGEKKVTEAAADGSAGKGAASQPAPAALTLPEKVPTGWEAIAAKTEGHVLPFDEFGKPGKPAEMSDGFFRMVQGYLELPEAEKPAYLKWLATTHESSDVRIWACSTLADQKRAADLRDIQAGQEDERVQRCIENLLERLADKQQGKKKGKNR